jgi:hypothetical protein
MRRRGRGFMCMRTPHPSSPQTTASIQFTLHSQITAGGVEGGGGNIAASSAIAICYSRYILLLLEERGGYEGVGFATMTPIF